MLGSVSILIADMELPAFTFTSSKNVFLMDQHTVASMIKLPVSLGTDPGDICDWASKNGPSWHKLHTIISILCYDATNLKKMVKFYVPTWTLFAGPVTYGMTSHPP